MKFSVFSFRFSDGRRHATFDIRLSTPRRGMSILEILFAILVTSVGLLGAIALFPVASAQARKARINDATAAAGRSAVHTFDALGMRRWERWVGYSTNWDVPGAGGTPLTPGFYTIGLGGSKGSIR